MKNDKPLSTSGLTQNCVQEINVNREDTNVGDFIYSSSAPLASSRLALYSARQGVVREPDERTNDLATHVIGCAIEVHRHLGPGYLESVYEDALAVELTQVGIPFERQALINIWYKGNPVGESRLDFLVDNRLVVELKAVEQLSDLHRAQLISYLKVTEKMLGLIINFNVPVLKEGIQRMVLSKTKGYGGRINR